MTPTSVSLTLYNGDKSRIAIKIKLHDARAACRNTVTLQIFIEHLLFPRHHSRHHVDSNEQNRQTPIPMELKF